MILPLSLSFLLLCVFEYTQCLFCFAVPCWLGYGRLVRLIPGFGPPHPHTLHLTPSFPSDAFERRLVSKRYVALVAGELEGNGSITVPLDGKVRCDDERGFPFFPDELELLYKILLIWSGSDRARCVICLDSGRSRCHRVCLRVICQSGVSVRCTHPFRLS